MTTKDSIFRTVEKLERVYGPDTVETFTNEEMERFQQEYFETYLPGEYVFTGEPGTEESVREHQIIDFLEKNRYHLDKRFLEPYV